MQQITDVEVILQQALKADKYLFQTAVGVRHLKL